MNDNQGFMDNENLIERKKRLEEELDKKVSNDYREFIEKSNEYLQKTKENTIYRSA